MGCGGAVEFCAVALVEEQVDRTDNQGPAECADQNPDENSAGCAEIVFSDRGSDLNRGRLDGGRPDDLDRPDGLALRGLCFAWTVALASMVEAGS